MSGKPFITLEPNTPPYKQFIRTAIKVRDKYALFALKGNTTKPIRFVTGWFHYTLMAYGNDQSPYVIIYSPQARTTIVNHMDRIGKPILSDVIIEPIPDDTYAFLEKQGLVPLF